MPGRNLNFVPLLLACATCASTLPSRVMQGPADDSQWTGWHSIGVCEGVSLFIRFSAAYSKYQFALRNDGVEPVFALAVASIRSQDNPGGVAHRVAMGGVPNGDPTGDPNSWCLPGAWCYGKQFALREKNVVGPSTRDRVTEAAFDSVAVSSLGAYRKFVAEQEEKRKSGVAAGSTLDFGSVARVGQGCGTLDLLSRVQERVWQDPGSPSQSSFIQEYFYPDPSGRNPGLGNPGGREFIYPGRGSDRDGPRDKSRSSEVERAEPGTGVLSSVPLRLAVRSKGTIAAAGSPQSTFELTAEFELAAIERVTVESGPVPYPFGEVWPVTVTTHQEAAFMLNVDGASNGSSRGILYFYSAEAARDCAMCIEGWRTAGGAGSQTEGWRSLGGSGPEASTSPSVPSSGGQVAAVKGAARGGSEAVRLILQAVQPVLRGWQDGMLEELLSRSKFGCSLGECTEAQFAEILSATSVGLERSKSPLSPEHAKLLAKFGNAGVGR